MAGISRFQSRIGWSFGFGMDVAVTPHRVSGIRGEGMMPLGRARLVWGAAQFVSRRPVLAGEIPATDYSRRRVFGYPNPY
jgi:hypothetical protein